MKGIKRLGPGLIGAAAVAVALGAGLLVSSQVLAQDETVSVGDGSAPPGEEASVDLEALNMPSPGLAAWTIDVAYDPTVVTAVACAPAEGAVCNEEFAAGVVRVSGATAVGVEGDSTLASITFSCEAEGTSDLAPTVETLADGTIGGPQPIDASMVSGTFTCAVSPTAELPPSGTGSDSSGSSALGWLIATLAGAGLAAVAGFGALRLRARRS